MNGLTCTPEQLETVHPRVIHGAKMLDEKFPGWAEQINTSEIRMSSACHCILGQLAVTRGGDVYSNMLDMLGLKNMDDVAEAGFDVTADELSEATYATWYDALRRAWICCVEARTTVV
jgi:hypothetical protein